MHVKGNFHHGARGGVKETVPKTKAPQVEHHSAMEARDGGGAQHSEHPAKNQSKKMRFLRR